MKKTILITCFLLITSLLNAQTYQFNTAIQIEVSQNNTNDNTVFEYFFDKSNPTISCFKVDSSKMGGGDGNMYMVLEKNKSTMYMNAMGMKMKKTVSQKQMAQFGGGPNIDDTEITKTGNTKSILGYACSEYTMKGKNDDKTTIHLWATTSDFPIKSRFIPILGMKNNNSKIKGFVLEIKVTHKKGSNTIKVIKIDKNAQLTINTSDYKSFGF